MVGGGSELLTATDLRVLGPSTLVAFVHTTMGISPGWGGAVRLAGVVGRKRALRLMMGEVRAQSGTGGAAGGRLGPARELEPNREPTLGEREAPFRTGRRPVSKQITPAELRRHFDAAVRCARWPGWARATGCWQQVLAVPMLLTQRPTRGYCSTVASLTW